MRTLVLWLEDQKIRHYKIEERADLRKIDSPRWTNAFKKYLQDLACSCLHGTLIEQLEWLISYAVKLEYSDNGKYKS